MGKSYDSEESIRFIENLYDQIESYLTKAAPLESDYHRYVNNETFVGKAAEASKRFIRDKQLQYHYEQQNIQNKLYNMYGAIQGEFEDAVDASPKARIDTDVLKGIKRDVENFYDALNYGGRCIEDEAAYVQEKADEFSDIYQFTFTQPDYDPARRSYEELCGDGEYIDKCIKDFERFDENAWNYVNRSGLEEYVNELTADINAKAAGLDQMEVYKPEMEDTLVKVIGMGGPKAIKETNIHDVFRSYDGKEKLQRMEQGAKILSALGDYIEPKLKELGHKAIKLEPNNAIFLRATSMGMYTFFELAGGVQSYLETGSFSDAEKNAKINYKAFQRGGLNCAVETVTGFLKLPELGIKIGKGIGGTIEQGANYIKDNGTSNLPDDLAAWAGDKGKQVVNIYNILKDEFINKVNTMSVEEGYESAGYLLTTIGTMVVGGEFGEASKGGEVAKGAEVAGEATETVVNSLDDIERVADKIDDVERVVDKLDDVEKVVDKAGNAAEEVVEKTSKVDDCLKDILDTSGNVSADKISNLRRGIQKGDFSFDEIKEISEKMSNLGITEEFESEMKKINFGEYLKKMEGPPPKDMINPHAHHVLFKTGNGVAQQELVKQGQAILREAGIDPVLGLENLVWAPNKIAGQHSIASLEKVVEGLKTVYEMGGDYEDIVETLTRMGRAASTLR